MPIAKSYNLKNPLTKQGSEGFFVRAKGLEPPRLAAPDPKSGTSTNFATPAFSSLAIVRKTS